MYFGGDISELSYVEECGGKYYTKDGEEKPCEVIMAEAGCNIVRIRNYNTPGRGRGWVDPKDGTIYYRIEKISDLEDNLKLMKRAKQAGLTIEYSFHYSDYWTNDYTGLIPADWARKIENKSFDESVDILESELYEYTKNAMEAMRAQDTLPEFVSIGNEIQSGFLFPYGHCAHFNNLVRFINAGIRAVKEVSPKSKIIIHLDDCCNKFKYGIFLGNLRDYGVEYDLIGTSYYPFWCKHTIEDMVEFCNYLAEEFEKDIMIMETGYNFAKTLPNGEKGQLMDCGPYEETWGADPRSQERFLKELLKAMSTVKDGRCVGALYWDPIMVEQPGVGWAKIEGATSEDDAVTTNIVSNTTLFDFEHKALPGLYVLK